MKISVILLFAMSFFSAFSATRVSTSTVDQQNAPDSLMIWDKLNIQCDPKIIDLLKQEAAQNKKNGTISGFRLQLYFGSGEKAHAQAIKIKTEFLSSNPDVKTYLLFRSPDFIVRVGNFRTKSEALKMQKAILSQYPNAFIVADDIAFPDLVNNTTNN
ncbi:MAG TPA: SPOR domain-containing protein [Prolixibacteraceae bacterium]